MANVPERVKKALYDKGWTQKKLCGEINITETGFKRMVDNNTWKLDTLEKMSAALGVPIVYFIDDDEKNTTSDSYLKDILLRMEEKINKLTADVTLKERQIDKLIDLLGKPEGAILQPICADDLKYQTAMRDYLQSVIDQPFVNSIFLPNPLANLVALR